MRFGSFGIRDLPLAVALVLAAYALSLVFSRSIAWSNPEYLVYSLPNALDNGLGFTWKDLAKAFDPLSFDVVRPRFINYLITVVNIKFRLALYEFFIPPANLSLMLLVHLVASPLLFFLTVRNLVGPRAVALVAACAYLTSVGFLSTSAFFVQPGKVLIHPMTLLLLWILSGMQKREPARFFHEQAKGQVVAVCVLNLVALAIDDTYAIVALVACVLFWRPFFPRRLDTRQFARAALAGVVFFSPFLLFVLFAWKVAPGISESLGAGSCNYVGFALGQSGEAAKTSLAEVFWRLTGTALASSVAYHPFPAGFSAVQLELSRAARFAVALAVTVMVYVSVKGRMASEGRQPVARDVHAFSALAALLAYFLLQSFVQRFHVQITGSYYYASLTAIFFSIVLATAVASLPPARQWLGHTALALLMGFQLANFVDLNRRWKVMHMPLIPYSLEKVRGTYKNVVDEGALAPSEADAQRMTGIWKAWKDGRRSDLSAEPRWPAPVAWFLVDMNALSGFVYRDPVRRCK